MARKYTKKSSYWNNLSKTESTAQEKIKLGDLEIEDIALADTVSIRNRVGGATTMAHNSVKERFRLLDAGLLPYEANSSIVNIRDAIELCQKAYVNVSIFRNTIDGMVEFSDLPIHVKMKSKRAQKLLEEWLERVKINKIKTQFFREYYRSGNVPVFKLRGKFQSDHFKSLKAIFKNAKNDVTVGYTILNPAYVGVTNQSYGEKTYVRIFSRFEIEELKQQKTDNDKERFNALPENVRKNIKIGASHQHIYTAIDKKDLSMIFYNKQDYEYMAVPMGYPVLDDIEWKLSLKDMDRKLSKAIDRVILLITMGDKDNGVNQKNYEKKNTEYIWVSEKNIATIGMPTLFSKIRDLVFENSGLVVRKEVSV
jgi:hypothetical protein